MQQNILLHSGMITPNILVEYTLKCSQLISFLGNKKSSSNQNVWRDHATMQQDVLLLFWVILKSGWNMKKMFCCPALELFHCLGILNCKMRIPERFSHIVEREAACWRKCPLNQLWQHRHRLSTRQCGLSQNKVRLVVAIPLFIGLDTLTAIFLKVDQCNPHEKF